MKYMVGYQIRPTDDWIDAIIQHKESIYEVYFSWSGMPSGRNMLAGQQEQTPWEVQQRQMRDLKKLAEQGISFNLLFNANCYGRHSQSTALFQSIGQTVDYVKNHYGLQSITTTSPLIARFIKNNFPELETRASVNMKIGTVQGMDYVSDLFDGFYVERECNRNAERLGELKKWSDHRGKRLYLLANSGCFNHCSTHVFHDNLVAHENELSEMDNGMEFTGTCWDYLNKEKKQATVLRDTSYIRPEDIDIYNQWFSAAKLATRVNSNPVAVLEAYIKGSYSGSLLDLMEPNHSGAIYPMILENKRIPSSFAQRVLECDKKCDRCTYCTEIFEDAVVQLEMEEQKYAHQ